MNEGAKGSRSKHDRDNGDAAETIDFRDDDFLSNRI